MKLSKSNEETLKGLAKLLKDFSEGAHPGDMSHINGLAKDLRQLRKNLKELPEPNPCAEVALEIEPQVGKIESEFEDSATIFVNPDQLAKQQSLLGVRYPHQGTTPQHTVPLYRKKTT